MTDSQRCGGKPGEPGTVEEEDMHGYIPVQCSGCDDCKPEPSEAAVDFVSKCRNAHQQGDAGEVFDHFHDDLAREYDAALREAEGRGLELVDLERQLQADCNQTNPTKWAYEQACKALHKHRNRADKAEDRLLTSRDNYHDVAARWRGLQVEVVRVRGLLAELRADRDTIAMREADAHEARDKAEAEVGRLKEEMRWLRRAAGIQGV